MTDFAIERLRGVARASRLAQDARTRTPPRLRAGEEPRRRPRVLYLCPDPTQPRGGVRVIYRHVELLREMGVDAAVVHQRPGYRATWFAHRAPVLDARTLAVGSQDVLVVPELFGARLDELPPGPRLVLFNQGPFYTFDGVSVEDSGRLADPRVSLVLTVSDYGAELLGHAFPDVPVHVARPVVDHSVFHPADGPPTRRRIAYATNRRHHERHQLLSILQLRGALAGWEAVPVAGMSEQEVAATLRSSTVFISMSEQDGFGLPPAEAMASGCYVVGFTGYGGREFFDPAHCRPVPEGDLLALARAVEETVESAEREPARVRAAGLAASRAVLARYDEDGLRRDLLGVYEAIGVVPAPR